MIDPQSSRITSDFAIDAAGVTNLLYPFKIEGTSTSDAHTVTGSWNISAKVPKTDRGTHMSRLIEGLERLRQNPVSIKTLAYFAKDLTNLAESENVAVETQFTWFRSVAAPVTGITALLDHSVKFSVSAGEKISQTITMEVAAKSVCPCSKAISERGAHNQRSLISASVTLDPEKDTIDLATLSDLLQHSASSPVYPILKRADEKKVTEDAFDHPVFVEDIARNVATRLVDISSITSFVVNVRNLESIHSHDCFATIRHSR